MSKLYYTAPEDVIFEEVRREAISLWHFVDSDNDKYGYASEKIGRIKDIGNVQDNMMYIVAMFDLGNQALLSAMLSPEAREAIRVRMIDGGQPIEYIAF